LFTKIKGIAKDHIHGEPNALAVFDYIYGILKDRKGRTLSLDTSCTISGF